MLGILFTFWVMGFLIYKQKGSFFLPRGTGIKSACIARMPSSTLIPFWGGLGSLLNPFKQKRGTLVKPWLLGSLDCVFQGSGGVSCRV